MNTKRMVTSCRSIILFLAVSLSFAAGGMVAKTGFSGTWLLDKKRSEGLPSGMNQIMTVIRSGNVIRVKTKLITEKGEQTVTDVYELNGREVEFSAEASGGATSRGRRVARWTSDGMGIEVHEVSTINTPKGQMTVETARRWALSPDSKSLAIKMTVKGPQGTQENKRLFVRK